MLAAHFTAYSGDKLAQLDQRISLCLATLNDEQIWARGHASENAIGNLVLHLSGNVRQWILCGVGSAPDQRDRDAEFAALGGEGRHELQNRLRETVAEAVTLIRSLAEDDLARCVCVQKYDVTVLEAIYHVVEHFSMHTGQVIFATKMLTGQDLDFYRHLKADQHQETTP